MERRWIVRGPDGPEVVLHYGLRDRSGDWYEERLDKQWWLLPWDRFLIRMVKGSRAESPPRAYRWWLLAVWYDEERREALHGPYDSEDEVRAACEVLARSIERGAVPFSTRPRQSDALLRLGRWLRP